MHLALIGYGNIAQTLVELLHSEPVEHLTIFTRKARRAAIHAETRTPKGAGKVTVTDTLPDLLQGKPDVVVECAGQGAVRDLVPDILDAGIATVLTSIGALSDAPLAARLHDAAMRANTRLILPAGAIGGIDLLAALAPAGDLQVSYRGTKPPAAWKGTPAQDILDLDTLTKPTVFFTGTARDAARSYPKNANVAATLALAGAGFDATHVDLVADPTATGNQHTYEVRTPVCQFQMNIDNAPSGANAKTSVATVYSVLREINRFRHATLV